MKKIAIIGAGGRIGAMFAHELKGKDILGIGREGEVKDIKSGNILLKTNKGIETLKIEAINDSDFSNSFVPEAIFLCTKNPITSVVKYYYQIIKEKGGKIPILFVPQNGISASDEAREALKDVFGDEAEKIKSVRISLFNSVSREVIDGKVYLSYTLPIRLCFAPMSGSFENKEIEKVFEGTGIEAESVSSENVRNMEFSKLFLNLIGMASASHGLIVEQGFKDKKVLSEEVGALREYIKIVEKSGSHFLNFSHYPVNLMTFLFKNLPMHLIIAFRVQIGEAISKGRRGKKKDLDEIEYYNGSVVELGKKISVDAPINRLLIERVIKNNINNYK